MPTVTSNSTEVLAARGTAGGKEHTVVPGFRVSDLWRAPLHDLPVRNEILFENLDFTPGMRVLEIGPGSGFTAFLLSRTVSEVTVADVGRQHLLSLESRLRPQQAIHFVCADFSQDCSGLNLNGQFDRVFALDVLEYVPNPAEFLRNVARLLRPAGRMLVTFPNFLPPEGDGVTAFRTLPELTEIVASAGFGSFELHALKLNRYAQFIYDVCHELPVRVVRRLRKSKPGFNPQTYDQTWAYRNLRRFEPLKLGLHAYWEAVLWSIRRHRQVFAKGPLEQDILREQILVIAGR